MVKKILVTGGYGMMGRTMYHITKNIVEYDFVFLSRDECDLRNRLDVMEYFQKNKFDYVVHFAAAVGGLYKNLDSNISMFSDNIKINENVLEACHKNGIKRGIFCLSSCIYPALPSKFPMDENMIHESPPHPSNEGYAYAKRMLELQTRQYNKMYGYQYICVIPVNLYGFYDNFNLKDSHMIPGLMHRFFLNSLHNEQYCAYGTGKPMRQFLYSFDFAKIIMNILFDTNEERISKISSIICCDNNEYTIKDIVFKLANVMDIKKELINWDSSKSDGCMKKTVTNNKLLELYPDITFTPFEEGLENTYNWFVKNYESENFRK
jgi:GDP-L-fucose synthase